TDSTLANRNSDRAPPILRDWSVTIPVGKDAITMADQFLTPGWYLQRGSWPYGDQRRALLPLYDHPNAQVRLKAVKATLAVAPERARRMLEIIADSREYPQAGDAGMTIDALDQGIFKPT